MNAYADLHLENTVLPANAPKTSLHGLWENDDHAAFYLSIDETEDGVCYECDLLPFNDESADMQELNALLEAQGYEANGYGWEEYLEAFIEENLPSVYPKLGFDSETDTCGVYVYNSIADFREMLAAVSRAVRELAQ